MLATFVQSALPVMGSEKLAISNTAKGLTASKYFTFDSSSGNRKEAKYALITVEGDQARFSLDPAVTPTSSTGHLLGVGDSLILESPAQIATIQFIRVTNDSTLQVTYFGGPV